MLYRVSINVSLCLCFDQHALNCRFEEVEFLIEVVEFERESYIGLLQACNLSLLSKFKPFDLQREHWHAIHLMPVRHTSA